MVWMDSRSKYLCLSNNRGDNTLALCTCRRSKCSSHFRLNRWDLDLFLHLGRARNSALGYERLFTEVASGFLITILPLLSSLTRSRPSSRQPVSSSSLMIRLSKGLPLVIILLERSRSVHGGSSPRKQSNRVYDCSSNE